MRYHITNKGLVKECRAEISCPLDSKLHFDSQEQAEALIELANKKAYGAIPTEPSTRRDDSIEESRLKVIPKSDHEFFPTPEWLGREMCAYIDTSRDNLRILEPQAGAGALAHTILNHGKANGVTINLDMIEYDDNLRKHLESHSEGSVIGDNFLELESDQKYDYIFMNPPYSTAELHIEKAISHLEATGGGTLVTQASANFLKPWDRCANAHALIKRNAYSIVNKGNPYNTDKVERTTDVDVVFIVVKV